MQNLASAPEALAGRRSVRIAASNSYAPDAAVAELVATLDPESAACVIFFCSPSYDLHALGRALAAGFGETTLIGCTTAGGVDREGIITSPIVAMALDATDFAVESVLLKGLSFADEDRVTAAVERSLANLGGRARNPLSGFTFAFSVLDGLSTREEMMLPVISRALKGIPLVGGSAGDAMDFTGTFVYSEGSFQENAAAIALVNSSCPFQVLSSHHFAASKEKLVVTRADPERRVVLELNAEPAAPEYCRVMGLSLDDLSDATFACHPLGVQLGEHLFTRSIRQVNDDLSLTFFCAIDSGIVLTKLDDTGLLEHFSAQMRRVHHAIGPPQLVLGCDCIHRHHEAARKSQLGALTELYRRFSVMGFNTFGEQRDGLHLNHSFTGIAIGYANG